MAKKKINCKDGLNWQEELQARKIREKLKSGDRERLKELKNLYIEWCNSSESSFLQWLLLKGQRVWYSALKRMDDWMEFIW